MATPSNLLTAVEAALLGPSPATPAQRLELLHALRAAQPALKTFLSYPPPTASDRAQIQSKEVRLPDSGLISLDDRDVQIAGKLSDDLNLNEVDCVRLLVSANQEWGLIGREPLEILRLAVGLWYTERRDIITFLYTLLRAVVLDPGLEADLRAEICKYLEDLFETGLRQRLITLIKELGREEPSGIGGPHAEPFLLDSKGALVERKAVVSRERLSLGHCLGLSVLVVRLSTKDVKDVFFLMQNCAIGSHGTPRFLALQIVYSLLFSLVIAFTSDALSSVSVNSSVLSQDVSFKREFHELVMTISNDPHIEGFVDVVRFSWLVYLLLTLDERIAKDTISGASTGDLTSIYACLDHISSNNVFEFIMDNILRTVAFLF